MSCRRRDCVAIAKSAIKVVMPVKTGIQTSSRRRTGTSSKLLDSPVSSTGQALRRAPLARNDKRVMTTKSRKPVSSIIMYFLDSGLRQNDK